MKSFSEFPKLAIASIGHGPIRCPAERKCAAVLRVQEGHRDRIPVVVEVSHVSWVDRFMTQKCRCRSHYKCRWAAGDDRQTRVNLCSSRPLKCPVSLKGANNALVSLRCGGDDDPPTVSRACHNDNDDMNIHDSLKWLTFGGVASTEWWWLLISIKGEQSMPNVHDDSR
ncbi:hypothetical protein QTP88_006385 [Uroleucon formosanum]